MRSSRGRRAAVSRTDLLTVFLRKAVSRVEIKRVDFRPGQRGPIHRHPCPVVGYVSAGAVLMQVKGETARTVRAGEAFFEPAHEVILHFDNASKRKPASFIAFYLLSGSDRELVEFLNPPAL